jgi:hypothetical protein
MGDSLKWVFEFTSEDDEKPETTEIEELIGMSVAADPEPVTPEEIGNEVVKARKITDQKTLEVAERIIALIEKGVAPWTQGWTAAGFLPTNGKTKKSYQGTNTMILWAAMAENGWTDPRFLSFNQGKALGGFVRKGEKGTTILKPNKVVREVKQPDGSTKKEGYIYFTNVSVFNVAQFDNLKLPPLVSRDPVPVSDIEKKILETYKDHPEIIYKAQDTAYYSPSMDKIFLPLREFFKDENSGFQSWCADMWAVLWNIWLREQETKVVPELAFAWATDPISKLDTHTIFHNAGIVGTEMNGYPCFYKGKYHQGSDPMRDLHLDAILNNEQSKKFCTWHYTEKLNQLKNKYNL